MNETELKSLNLQVQLLLLFSLLIKRIKLAIAGWKTNEQIHLERRMITFVYKYFYLLAYNIYGFDVKPQFIYLSR